MVSKPHVLQLITALPYGGAEHTVRDLVAATDDVQFSVGFFGPEDALAADIEATGATVRHFDESFRFDPRAIVRFNRFLKENHVDVLHLHLPYAQTIGRVIGSLNVDDIVSTQHNVPKNYHLVTRTTERITRPLDDVTVAVSKGVERAFTGSAHTPGQLDNNWCTIYNGIDVDEFGRGVENADGHSIRQQLDIPPDAPLFLNVGRYVPVKGQTTLIEAFAQSALDAHLVIIGHGPLKDTLRSEISNRGVENTVHVTGRVPEVHPYYAAADVFVSASESEGHPITVLEAMAATLPVIAPDIPGVREAVNNDETGVLYSPDRTGRLVQAMAELIEDEEQTRYGRAGYKRVESQFDVQIMANTYLRLYKRLQLSGEN